jgi:hypothetical protein
VSGQQGSQTIRSMIVAGEVQQVAPSRERADKLLAQARRHLSASVEIRDQDPEGAYVLIYDAARKALVAVLENQGLRPTTRGGHLATYQAVRAQLDPPLGQLLAPFDRMRRARHSVEYPTGDSPELTPADVADDEPKARAIVDAAARVLDEMPVFR